MMLIGVLWAMLAPFLLALPIVLLYRLSARWPLRGHGRGFRLGFAIIASGLPVGILYHMDSARFDQHCDTLGEAVIHERRPVEGFFLDDPTANSFGMRYLHEEGFRWIEARSIYRRDGFTRYEKSGETIAQHEIPALSTTLTVRSEHTRSDLANTTLLQIVDRQDGRLLAQAASAHFNGGRTRWVLGAWGARSCPNPVTPSGAKAFQDFYHLARLTLGTNPR